MTLKFYLRLAGLIGTGTFVNLKNYSDLHEAFIKDMAKMSSDFSPIKIPVAFKKVKTAIGVCFFMSTKLSGTTERKYQGNYLFINVNNTLSRNLSQNSLSPNPI